MDFFKTYGIYLIKKGTTFFRKAKDSNYYDNMFFSFCPYGTFSSSHKENQIQIWETTAEIKSLFMVKEKVGSHFLSSIIDIYNFHFPSDIRQSEEYLLIKKEDNPARERLIKLLKQNNIFSWVCSIENKGLMELFLFDSQIENQKLIKCIAITDNKDASIYEIDSFNYGNYKTCS